MPTWLHFSCTSVFRASHGFDLLGVGYHHFKEADPVVDTPATNTRPCSPCPRGYTSLADPFFAPLTALICWALATTTSKKPILSSIHLQPIHARALHAHVATLLL